MICYWESGQTINSSEVTRLDRAVINQRIFNQFSYQRIVTRVIYNLVLKYI